MSALLADPDSIPENLSISKKRCDIMYFRNELSAAMREVQIAWNHFNNADPEFVESAILKLNAAEKAYNALYSISGSWNGVRFEKVAVNPEDADYV